VTKELADDLDELRKAPDFTEQTMQLLVQALKSTASVYSEDTKRTVMVDDWAPWTTEQIEKARAMVPTTEEDDEDDDGFEEPL